MSSYTKWYVKTYFEWADERAKRMQDFFRRNPVFTYHQLIWEVYRERFLQVHHPYGRVEILKKLPKFIRNYIDMIIDWMKELNYIEELKPIRKYEYWERHFRVKVLPPVHFLRGWRWGLGLWGYARWNPP